MPSKKQGPAGLQHPAGKKKHVKIHKKKYDEVKSTRFKRDALMDRVG